MRRIFRSALLACAIVQAGPPGPALGQDVYPRRPVRLIVPFGPGGSTDIVGRVVALKLGDAMGQSVVVDNRAGAGSLLGIDLAAKAQPDGYTFVIVTVAYAINPSMYKKLPFDPERDLTPVGMVASAPNLLVINPSLPANNLAEFVAAAKKAQYLYGSAGTGTPTHLAAELFNAAAGLKLTHVPYKSGGAALNDIIGGQVQLMFAGIVSAIGFTRSGRLKAIALTGPVRSKIVPDVPTIAESGYPGYEAVNWYSVLAPAGTPKAILDKVNGQLNVVLQKPDMIEALGRDGAEPVRTTPDAAKSYISGEIAKWRKVVQQAGVTAE